LFGTGEASKDSTRWTTECSDMPLPKELQTMRDTHQQHSVGIVAMPATASAQQAELESSSKHQLRKLPKPAVALQSP
jgi:hypothetical protein